MTQIKSHILQLAGNPILAALNKSPEVASRLRYINRRDSPRFYAGPNSPLDKRIGVRNPGSNHISIGSTAVSQIQEETPATLPLSDNPAANAGISVVENC